MYSAINKLKYSHTYQILLSLTVGLGLFVVLQVIKPAPAQAAWPFYWANYCSDASNGNPNAYAGLAVNLQWIKYETGAINEATGPVGAHVETWGGTWSPPGNVLNLHPWTTSEAWAARYFAVDFGQAYRPDCNFGGWMGIWDILGDSVGVVLDYNSNWVLDCDTSLHWWYAQWFIVNGWGTPTGARAGGSWDFNWVNPANGSQAWITLRYHEPAPPPPPISLSCGNVTVAPSPPEPSEDFTVTVSVSYGAPPAPPPSRPGQTMSVTIAGLYNNADAAYTTNGSAAVFTTPTLNQSAAGQYAVSWSLSGSGVSSGACSGSVTIAAKPYLRVYGGDVITGSGFGESCTPLADSKIIAFNKGNGIGAGSEFAAQSISAITEFASALGRNANPEPNKGLTFANTGSGFGGSFGTGLCAKDYFASASGALGNTTIAATNIANGQHTVTYIDGDATITGNIIYTGSGGWAALSQIPSYYLIVRGNIYIDSSVTRLDGVYIAQPKTDGTKGKIYTCTSGSSQIAAGNLYNICNTKLTINGAFMAQQVKFLRANGSLKNSSNNEPLTSANIAEVFVFSPELWLTNPGISPGNSSEYDSITSLPPVL